MIERKFLSQTATAENLDISHHDGYSRNTYQIENANLLLSIDENLKTLESIVAKLNFVNREVLSIVNQRK